MARPAEEGGSGGKTTARAPLSGQSRQATWGGLSLSPAQTQPMLWSRGADPIVRELRRCSFRPPLHPLSTRATLSTTLALRGNSLQDSPWLVQIPWNLVSPRLGWESAMEYSVNHVILFFEFLGCWDTLFWSNVASSCFLGFCAANLGVLALPCPPVSPIRKKCCSALPLQFLGLSLTTSLACCLLETKRPRY